MSSFLFGLPWTFPTSIASTPTYLLRRDVSTIASVLPFLRKAAPHASFDWLGWPF